jgi:hypothetical protein
MDKRLDNIENRLDSIDETLIKQHASLMTHMRRSDALEAQVQPMHDLMTELKGVVKFLKFIGVIVGIIEAIRMVWH